MAAKGALTPAALLVLTTVLDADVDAEVRVELLEVAKFGLATAGRMLVPCYSLDVARVLDEPLVLAEAEAEELEVMVLSLVMLVVLVVLEAEVALVTVVVLLAEVTVGVAAAPTKAN